MTLPTGLALLVIDPWAWHVITENRRVLGAAELLRVGQLSGAGPLLTASHASLRWCPERQPPSRRRRSAAVSGAMSLAKAPIPDSDPARYFSLPGARRMVKSSR